MNRFRIIVYLNRQSASDGKKVFERIVERTSSLDFPFDMVCAVLRLLFGHECVVVVESELDIFKD